MSIVWHALAAAALIYGTLGRLRLVAGRYAVVRMFWRGFAAGALFVFGVTLLVSEVTITHG